MKNEKLTFQELEKVIEQLKSEKEEKQNLFQILFTDNRTINLIVDKETGTIVNANKAACNFYGYSLEEMIGMNLNQINILSEKEIKQEIARITDNQLYFYNLTHRLKNGEIREVELYSGQIDIGNRKLLYSTIFDLTSQKQTEKALTAAKQKASENELFFKTVCEQATDGINLSDLEGNFTFVNQAYCSIVGYSENELLKMKVQDLKVDSEKSVFHKTIEVDYTFFRTYKIKCKDTSVKYVDLSTKKISFHNQHLVLGIIRDVTERVTKENELRIAMDKVKESEQQLSDIFSNMQDAYFEADIQGRFVKTNATAPKIYGYTSVDEMLNMPALNLYANENDRKYLIDLLSNKGQVTDFICQGKRKDGSEFWVSMNVQYKYDTKGNITGTVGVVRDITDRKIQDEKIKESEEKYRNIYDNAIEGMFRTSIDGKSLQANKALAQILGYKTAEDAVNNVNNSASQTWLYASDRLKYMELLDKHEVVNGFESRFKRIDGEIIWVSMNVKLIRGENAEKLYYEGFLEDITDRKHKELEIKKKMENLQWHYDIAIQRELKMVELKKEINELLVKLGKEKKY